MQKLKSLISSNKQKTKGKKVIIRAEVEEEQRQEYLKAEEQRKIDDEKKLGKKLMHLEDFYKYAKLNYVEPKKVIKNLKTKEEVEEEEKIKYNDTQKSRGNANSNPSNRHRQTTI